MIPFNKPYLSGKEIQFIKEAVELGKISGNGHFTKKCHSFFERRYNFKKCLLTTSCTDALEMCAILLDIQIGDEVIIPSYTFVSTANAFVLRGAKVVFVDSKSDHPNIDADQIEPLITKRTKAIVVVHYAGIACDMDTILKLSKKHCLFVVEDAAQAVESFYKEKPLGSIGHLAAFSFHETKNIISGEGGMLVVNDKRFEKRADIIWEKGTNRKAFFNNEVDKYGWIDIGSSFLPSELIAAFLFAQLENLESIQTKRKSIWKYYYDELKKLENRGKIKLPVIPQYATNNAHMFYILCENHERRDALILHLRQANVSSVFHYLPLHNSAYYKDKHDGRNLPMSEYFSSTLIRLPFYNDLTEEDQEKVVKEINSFYS
ncbi:MAG TPA: dTDP-4-amino-4,6-dideoxygalactose transaminase [Cyclobacteriaceae bacterium]|nr:dTDP-4-amino-4,6-dideoxygalactose transaminase [Cyclobacteriaceae bacterium]